MSLVTLVVTLIVVGVLLWLMNVYIPMDPVVKRIINIIIIVAIVLWVLNAFGLLTGLGNIQIGK